MSIAAQKSDPPAWRALLGYVRPHRWALLGGASLSLLTGATGLMLPLVARDLIDDLSDDRAITGALVLMSALVMANAALGALGSYVLRRTAESVVLGARRSLSSYLLRLRITAVDRRGAGGQVGPRHNAPTRRGGGGPDDRVGVRARRRAREG
ncbi:hypothetical protein ACFVIN_35690, partial [Streptomyces prasinus]